MQAVSYTVRGGGISEVPVADVGDFEVAATSVEMAKNMAIGWNLGNTLDATSGSGINSETSWGQPKTTQAMITAVKNAGFKTIRIPVSWHNHISRTDTTDYKIDEKWMARVKEVVDYAYNQNMCIILNVHHDNMSIDSAATDSISSNPGYAISDSSAIKSKSNAFLSKVWEQIATAFKDYDNRLVFEVLNEPRDVDGKFDGNEWYTTNQTIYDIITEYEKTCINAIRSVGGNENRFIMVPCYAATGNTSMMEYYKFPSDSTKGRLIFSVHAYSPYEFAMSTSDKTTFGTEEKNALDHLFNYLSSNYVTKGIGVVIGEMSASDKNNLKDRENWFSYYVRNAYNKGIPSVLWDNSSTVANGGDINSGECHGYLNRKNQTWYFPTLIKAAMSAVYGENYSENTGNTSGETENTAESGDDDGAEEEAEKNTEPSDTQSNISDMQSLISTPLDLTGWDKNTTIAASSFSLASAGTKLTFTVEKCTGFDDFASDQKYYNIKLQDKWGHDATILSGDAFSLSDVPGKFSYTPTEAEWTSIKANGLIVYGYGVKITSILLE